MKQIRSDYLFSYPHSENMRRKIVLSKRDNPLLIALIKESFSKSGEEYPSTTEPKYESGKRIVKAFNIIYDQINKYFANLPDEIVADRLKLFLDTIAESLSVAVIWSEDPGYSYALFQIVNDRGVLLTPAELLKARTMELLSPNKKLFETCEAAWDDILDDPGKDTKKYLSWYYTAKTANKTPKTVRAEKMHEAFEIDIFNTYGKRELGENEQAILAKEVISLQESVKKCRVLAEGKIPLANISPHINNLFYALVDGLKNDTAIPVFLNALEIQNEKTKIKLVNALTVLLAKFFFVAKTASNLHAGSIKSVYAAIAKEIQTGNYSIADFESKCREKIKKKNFGAQYNNLLWQDLRP